MGYSTKSIPFFSDSIKLDPHTATHARHLGPITLREFAGKQHITLDQVEETGEYIATRYSDGAFIQGPEIQ